MSSLGPGDQPSESGAAAPWGPRLPNPSLGPPTSWDPIFATYTAWLGALLTWAGACGVYMGTGKGVLDMAAGGWRAQGREPGSPLTVTPAPQLRT